MSTDIKPRPNHAIYIRTLRRMSPQARLDKAFELSRFTDTLAATGLKSRRPDLTKSELRAESAALKKKCHNRNY